MANPDWVVRETRDAFRGVAEEAGLFEGPKTQVGARLPKRLLETAKKNSGLTSTTEVLEYALAKMAIEDDFGPKLLALEGTIPADIDLEF